MIYLFCAEGFEECEGLLVKDLLNRANLEVKTVSLNETKQVTSSHKVKLECDILIDEVNLEDATMLILPGGMPGTRNLQKDLRLKELFLKAKESTYLAAICAAPLVLADFGLLSNKKATIYQGMEAELKEANYVGGKVVRDGRFITGNGLGAAMDFGFTLIEILLGSEASERVKKQIGY